MLAKIADPRIEITIGTVVIVVDCLDTPTSASILSALPIQSSAQTWGHEVYFSVPVTVEKNADAKDVIESGEIAFWVEGSCIAIGYGPTPISNGNEIRLAAKTNIWDHSRDELSILSNVNPGDPVNVKQLD